MNNIKERPLNQEELAEFEAYNQKGIQLLGVSDVTEPSVIVKAVDVFVDAWQDKRRGLLGKLRFRSGNPVETALALGIVWGNQIVRHFQWSWVCVDTEDNELYGVVSPDRSAIIYVGVNFFL